MHAGAAEVAALAVSRLEACMKELSELGAAAFLDRYAPLPAGSPRNAPATQTDSPTPEAPSSDSSPSADEDDDDQIDVDFVRDTTR